MIRRPLAAAAAAFGAGTAIQHLASGPLERAALAAMAVCLLCLLFFLLLNCNKIENKDFNGNEAAQDEMKRAITKFAVIAVVFSALGAAAGYSCEHRVSQFNDAYNSSVFVNGRIISVNTGADDKCSAVMEADSFSADGGDADSGAKSVISLERPERLMVYIIGIDGRKAAALTGRRVSATGEVSRPDGASDPGAFDYSLYLLSKDIRATLRVDAEQVISSGLRPGGLYRILNIIAVFKYDYEQRILMQLDDRCAQMLLGILFGDDSFMDDELKTSFQQNGLAHLLAASGLHAGFVYGLFNVLMRKPSTVRGNIPVMAVLVVYAALAGFSASVVRAVFMIIVHIVGRVTHRRYDFLTCIAFCALVLLIYRPANIFSSGFQLSFAAVLTLSIVLKKAEQITRGICRAAGDKKGAVVKLAAEPLAGMVALQLGMMPLTVRNFHYISLGGLFLNIPAIAIAGLIVPLGILLIPLAYIGGPAFVFGGNMEEMLISGSTT